MCHFIHWNARIQFNFVRIQFVCSPKLFHTYACCDQCSTARGCVLQIWMNFGHKIYIMVILLRCWLNHHTADCICDCVSLWLITHDHHSLQPPFNDSEMNAIQILSLKSIRFGECIILILVCRANMQRHYWSSNPIIIIIFKYALVSPLCKCISKLISNKHTCRFSILLFVSLKRNFCKKNKMENFAAESSSNRK